MSRVYLDACCIIYLIEADSPFHETVRSRLLQYRANPATRLLTSQLSRLECRVNPIRNHDDKLLGAYDSFFGASRLVILDITGEIIERATSLRAELGFKTPDAIHLASAIEANADLFVTGDVDLARCPSIVVELLRSD